MNPVRVALWIVIAISIFIVSLIIHKEFLKRSIFQEIYGKYKGNLEKKVKEENWFVSKYGVIENRSFLYKIDRLITMSGLKKTFPHLSGEVFIGILFISLITTAILVSNLAGNVFLGLFVALAVVTAEFLVVIFLSGRTYNQIEEDTSLFISILSNHAKGSSDIVTIMTRTLPSMDGPIRELIKKFLLDAEKTGDIDIAFDVMKESVDNRTFQTIIVNLKNCMHSIILQSKSQLKAIYKDNADTIEGNCDTTLFLGGKEKTTLKEMEELLGKETIDLYNTSDTRGTQQSYGMNYQKTGKSLMSQDEIAVMDGGKCIMQLRGVRPFFSDKYDITKHKQYKYLADYDSKNTFDIEKYVKNLHVAVIKDEDVVDVADDLGTIE